MAKTKQRRSRILSPRRERSFTFRGARFFTRNLGATDPMTEKWVWFASGNWTHDQADGVFSHLDAAVADRFSIWEHLGLSFAPKFRSPEQLEGLRLLRLELARTLKRHRPTQTTR